MLLQLLTVLAQAPCAAITRVRYYDPNLFIVIKLWAHLYNNNLVWPCSWFISVRHDAFECFFLTFSHLLAFKGMKVHRSFWFAFIYLAPRIRFPCFLSWHIFIRYQFHCKFHCWTKSEVLSVVIVLVFNYGYFNLHILGILAYSTTGWKPHQLFFLSSLFVRWEDFYILYMNTVIIIYSFGKDTSSSGYMCLLFQENKKKQKKQD